MGSKFQILGKNYDDKAWQFSSQYESWFAALAVYIYASVKYEQVDVYVRK